MNKILIPAVLAVTILVAGSFAFMPVQRVSTTHASTAGVAANDLTCTGCVDTTDIAANTITGADIAALGIDASGDFAAGVVDDAAIANGITVSKLADTAGITDVLFGTAALAAVLIGAGAAQTVTVTVTGADVTNDVVWCSLETATNNALALSQATITGANTVTAEVVNASAAGVTPAATDDVFCLVFKRP